MSHLKLIVGAGARDALRWARQHLYALLILTPLVLGMTYAGVGRLVSEHAELEPSPVACVLLAVLAVACLVALSMSRASTELYHLRGPESALDTLPVSVDTHLWSALAQRIARTAAVGLVALVARVTLGGGDGAATTATTGASLLLPSLVLFVGLLALVETLLALGWIHGGRVRGRARAALSFAALLPTVAACGLLLLMIVGPGKLAARWHAGLLVGSALLSAALFFVVLRLHRSWRASDLEYAKRLQPGSRLSMGGARALRRLFKSPPVAAQLARDMRLTLRGFSSAVYAVAGIAALVFVVLLAALTTGWLPSGVARTGFEATWLLPVMAVKFAAVFACATLASLVPVLVAHQAPHLWLERSVGTPGAELWRAKLWYARLISLPAPLIAWALGAASGAVPLFYVLPLFGEVVWLWWLVSTVVGTLAYEMPDQPGLAIILMLCAGLAAGFVVSLLWPMGLALYAFGLQQMFMRGQHLAHLHLVKEGD
ncbi:MAG: hypothetical protein LC754_08270 [Acidobacteria bacterium]|nr:hypothetical protein [Acidobacteriota bacterium]